MDYLTNINLNKNQVMNAVMHNLAMAPSNPVEGQVYYNTTDHAEYYYNGADWIQSDGLGASMTGADIITAINGSSSIIDDDNLSANVNNAINSAHSSHAISDVTGLQTALDGKVDDSQVLTNVPAGAVFTDTITTINGKTGAITKSDITALGIPAQDTVYTLPVAGASLGGIKSGTNITVDASGNVSVNDDSHNHVIDNIDNLQSALDAKETPTGAQNKATTAENNAKSYTDTVISNLLNSAPSTLDTLNELAQALDNDPNFATTVTNLIAGKTSKYVTTIGGATSVTVTHNLNSRDVVAIIRESISPYAQVIADIEFTTTNTLTVKFAVTPSAGAYTIVVVG